PRLFRAARREKRQPWGAGLPVSESRSFMGVLSCSGNFAVYARLGTPRKPRLRVDDRPNARRPQAPIHRTNGIRIDDRSFACRSADHSAFPCRPDFVSGLDCRQGLHVMKLASSITHVKSGAEPYELFIGRREGPDDHRLDPAGIAVAVRRGALE